MTSLAEDFVSEYFFAVEALEIVTTSLPVLLELYDFIHRELSLRITRDNAEQMTVKEVLYQLKSLFSSDDVKHFHVMFKDFVGKCGGMAWMLTSQGLV